MYKNSQSVKYANVTIPPKGPAASICSEVLADMPNDFLYVCAVMGTFGFEKTNGDQLASLAALWMGKKKGFLASIRNENYPDRLELVR